VACSRVSSSGASTPSGIAGQRANMTLDSRNADRSNASRLSKSGRQTTPFASFARTSAYGGVAQVKGPMRLESQAVGDESLPRAEPDEPLA
jgi:hypothetical protein